MKKTALRTALVLSGLLALAPAFAQPASAQVSLSIRFDTNNRPYYVQGNHRHYMTQAQAAAYYRRRDPHWYQAHQRQMQQHPHQFQQQWDHDHHGH